MNGNYFLALSVGIGIVAGLRSFTAPAVVAWTAHLGWLSLQASLLSFVGSTVAVVVLSLLALGELVADKLPITPRRTAVMPLLARICTGAFCGACLSLAAKQPVLFGALLGGAGAIIGAFAGYEIRRRLVVQLHLNDFVVAAGEDLIAIGFAFFLVTR